MKTLPVLAIFLGLTITACAGQGSAGPTNTPGPNQFNDVVDLYSKALRSFHLEGRLEIRAAKESDVVMFSSQLVGDGVVEGDYQLQFTVDSETIGILTFGEREVRGVGYTQDPVTGEWEIVDSYDAQDGVMAEIIPDGTVFTEFAEAMLDGLPTYRVTGTVPGDPEQELVVVWLGVDQAFIHQVLVEGRVAAADYEGLVSQSGDLFQSILFRLSRFNEPVQIDAPPVKAPLPAPFIAYQDNFDDSDSGWGDYYIGQNFEQGYVRGEFRIILTKPGLVLGRSAPRTASPSLSDFDVEVKARYEGAALSKSYGLVFRFQDNDNHYVFEIDPVSGKYRFRMQERDDWTNLFSWRASPHIIVGSAPNVVRVIARGSSFELYVNGKWLDTVVDQTFAEGRIGIFVASGNDPNGAEIFFDDLIVREFTTPIRITQAKERIEMGVELLQEGLQEEAIAEFDEAIRLDPQNSRAYYNRGNTYIDLGQYERAIQDYNEAIHLDPQGVEAYVNRALIYTFLGEDMEAQKDIDRAVGLGFDPGFLKTYIQDGILELKDRQSPALTTVPVHLWISNQSIGTLEVQMTVNLNGQVVFDQSVVTGDQHNVVVVDENIPLGSHVIDIGVQEPSVTFRKVIDVSGEIWLLVRFWYDPESVHENQQTPTITVDISDAAPGIK